MLRGQEADRFVEAWGSLGVLWGINRSMARIHALLVLADDPVELDTITKRLNISRGNASGSEERFCRLDHDFGHLPVEVVAESRPFPAYDVAPVFK